MTNTERTTLLERLTDMRAEARSIERRLERKEHVTEEQVRRYKSLVRMMMRSEKRLQNISKPVPYMRIARRDGL